MFGVRLSYHNKRLRLLTYLLNVYMVTQVTTEIGSGHITLQIV